MLNIIVTVVLVISVIVNIGWAVQIQRAKRIAQNALKLKDSYLAAIADKTITDEEKLAIANNTVPIIDDLAGIIQTMSNVFFRIFALLKK